jgi:uncharacterized Rossmann fold enzyme
VLVHDLQRHPESLRHALALTARQGVVVVEAHGDAT